MLESTGMIQYFYVRILGVFYNMRQEWSLSSRHLQMATGHPVQGRVEDELVFTKSIEEQVYARSAFAYMSDVMQEEIASLTQCASRRSTFGFRLRAVAALYHHIEVSPPERAMKLQQWNYVNRVALQARVWSSEQQRALDAIRDGTTVADVAESEGDRYLFVSGEPGSGKSEVLVHAAVAAANVGCNVLVPCPTGVLVHGYRARVPDDERITVETIHSSFCIFRTHDETVKYSPPTRLRRYELIILDEASQVDDEVTRRVFLAITELPQKPFVTIAADFQQLAPVSGGGLMRAMCDRWCTITLCSIHRTSDPVLLAFLAESRLEQPQKSTLLKFFRGRWLGHDLDYAVRYGLRYGQAHDCIFSWLCVTKGGVERVNAAALRHLGIQSEHPDFLYGDPKAGAGRINISVGVVLRLTRNLDKSRGFVNGAIGKVVQVLADHTSIIELTSGTRILLHPISVNGTAVLPCAYGYATTIRKAQGASLVAGALFFDHSYPAERGYGYVGASRFKTQAGLHYFGSIRRSDWLPRRERDGQQVDRSIESESEDSQDREDDENYQSSEDSRMSDDADTSDTDESDDEFDHELRRLSRYDGIDDGSMHEESESDEDLRPMQFSPQAKRGRDADLAALSSFMERS